MVTAIATASFATLGEHEQAAIRELGAYVQEASQLAAAAPVPAANTDSEINRIATEADEYLRLTLGQDRFNQLSFLAARDRRAMRDDPTPSPGAPDN